MHLYGWVKGPIPFGPFESSCFQKYKAVGEGPEGDRASGKGPTAYKGDLIELQILAGG